MKHLGQNKLSRKRLGSLVWLVPAAHPGLAETLDKALRDREKDLLKKSSSRRVRAVRPSLPGPDLVLKEFAPSGLASRLKRLFRGSPAAREWRILLHLHRAGAPVPEPAALATPPFPHLWSRSYLALRAVPGAVTLEEILLQKEPPPLPPPLLAEKLGLAVRAVHDAGVRQGDMHCGNILVSREGGVFLIDFHGATLSKGPLPVAARFSDIISLSGAFLLHGRRSDRHRFFNACCLGLPGLGDPREAARSLEMAARQNLYHVLRRYDRRPARRGKKFHEISRHNWRGMAERSERADSLISLLGPYPDETLEKEGRLIKDQPASSVYALTVGRSSLVIKIYRRPGIAGLPGRIFTGSKAKQAWINGHRLLHRGIETACPVLYLAEPLHSPKGQSLVAFEEMTDVRDLERFVRESDREAVTSLSLRLARALARMHDLHLANRDLKAQNILVTGDNRIVFIDPDGVSAVREADLYIMSRDLMRLNASFPPGRNVSLVDRLRFLRAYSRIRGLSRETIRALRFEILELTVLKWQKWRRKKR